MTCTSHVSREGFTTGKLPRQVADGIYWLGDCQVWEHDGIIEHTYSSAYLVVGAERSLLVDTGHPKDWPVVRDQIAGLVAKGVPAPSYIFPTHPEFTHGGNLGRWLTYLPEAIAVGDLRDMQLIFPKLVHRFVTKKEGDALELGGRTFIFLDAIFRDLANSMWGYDTKEQMLFSSDGLSFGHFHAEDQCGLFAEEIPGLPIPQLTGIFTEYALYWSRFKNAHPHLERLRVLMEETYPTRIIGSAHGSVVVDPATTMPLIREGILAIAEKKLLIAAE